MGDGDDTDGEKGFVYPNRDGDDPIDLSRRQVVAGSALVGATAAAGCIGDGDGGDDGSDGDDGIEGPPSVTDAPGVFVFNTGDGTVSVIDVEDTAVVGTVDVGLTASFPSNQYSPGLTDAAEEPLWINVDDGVRALAVGSLSTAAAVETGSGANWQERTPDGAHLVVSAREPAHRQLRIDADPSSERFGEVTAELDRTDEGGLGGRDGPGPCDVTIHPDGEYAYVPDLYGDTLTVVDVPAFEIVRQIDVPPVVGETARPWMGTIAADGETMLVEHDEGDVGTESVWDVSDPAAPVERARLTTEDGLGSRPLTSELTADGSRGFVFTPNSGSVTVVDTAEPAVAGQIDLGGGAFVGTWDPDRERLFVPIQSSDEVAVVDPAVPEITTRLDVGTSPYGATAARVRPGDGALAASPTAGAIARNRLSNSGTSYCVGNCDCGHRL